MKNATTDFVTLELESEITISSGAAATALMDDYSGVINISPFAVSSAAFIEGLLGSWRVKDACRSFRGDRRRVLPPNIINKLEIFMLRCPAFQEQRG
jgi:hypothetical protein